MSAYILKRKTYAMKNLSGGKDGFSLCGGYRNRGGVGVTSLNQHNIFTPFKKNEPVGYGGCCGSYPVHILSTYKSTNNPSIIKRDNMNTKGYLLSRYVYPCCLPVVKITGPLKYSQGIYVNKVKTQSSTCQSQIKTCDKTICIKPCLYKNIYNGAISASDYIDTGLMKNNCLHTPQNKEHTPVYYSHNGCNI